MAMCAIKSVCLYMCAVVGGWACSRFGMVKFRGFDSSHGGRVYDVLRYSRTTQIQQSHYQGEL